MTQNLTDREEFLVGRLNDLEEVLRSHRARCRTCEPGEEDFLALESWRLERLERELSEELLGASR